MPQVGDKIRLIKRPNGKDVYGVITEIDPGSTVFGSKRFKVKYDGDLIPPEDWREQSDFYLVSNTENKFKSFWDEDAPNVGLGELNKCTCGVDSIGEGKHSSWCNKG